MQLGQLDGISFLISSRMKIAVILTAILLSMVLAFIFLPLADGIVLGLVLAYIARPLYLKLHRHKRLGALIATLVIVMPIVLILGSGIFEIVRFIGWIFDNQDVFINSLFDFVKSIDVPPEYNEQIRANMGYVHFFAAFFRRFRFYILCNDNCNVRSQPGDICTGMLFPSG